MKITKNTNSEQIASFQNLYLLIIEFNFTNFLQL